MKKIFWFFLSLTVILISACGWQLRTQAQWPQRLHHIFVDGDKNQICAQIKSMLTYSGIDLVKSKQQAEFVLKIDDEIFTSQTSGVALIYANQLSQTTLAYSFKYSVIGKNKKIFIPATLIYISRTVNVNPNQMLASKNEETVVKQEMMQTAINQMINQLISKKAHKLLA